MEFSYLEENIAAVEIILTPDELNRLEIVAPKGVAAGDNVRVASRREALRRNRYPDMSTVNR
ncbi:hypothetical protein VB713_09490 [Anabaena cylindrica UHCC 0172]|uniref:hypothetical protein n=1 Tax=Anabaena cylindrica TaxID=1165 RepID=UPI002B2143CC|nr:hypothetical protein [Anabaena cylindrica]MEA5551204.1 hypothetical protein [Anabaena cylindrica UHCC 0172]